MAGFEVSTEVKWRRARVVVPFLGLMDSSFLHSVEGVEVTFQLRQYRPTSVHPWSTDRDSAAMYAKHAFLQYPMDVLLAAG